MIQEELDQKMQAGAVIRGTTILLIGNDVEYVYESGSGTALWY